MGWWEEGREDGSNGGLEKGRKKEIMRFRSGWMGGWVDGRMSGWVFAVNEWKKRHTRVWRSDVPDV